MGFLKNYGFQAEIRCVGFPPFFLRSKKITLELLAVVPPEGYMLAPGNLLGNLLNEGQSLGITEDREPCLNKVVGTPGLTLVASFKRVPSLEKAMYSHDLGSKMVQEKLQTYSGSLQGRRWESGDSGSAS